MCNVRRVCISDGWRAWLGNGWRFWAEDNDGASEDMGVPGVSELVRRAVPQIELDDETETSLLFLQLYNWNRFNKE